MKLTIRFFIVFSLTLITGSTNFPHSLEDIAIETLAIHQKDMAYHQSEETNIRLKLPSVIDHTPSIQAHNSRDTNPKPRNPYILPITIISNNQNSSINVNEIYEFHDVPSIRIESNINCLINVVITITNGISEEANACATTVNETRNVFVNQVLEAHNNYRQRHGAQSLVYNVTSSAARGQISESCQKIADLIIDSNSTYHRAVDGHGENILCNTIKSDRYPPGNEPVDIWYTEGKRYFDRKSHDNVSVLSTAHFTQIVWKNSREIGIGIAIRPTKYVIVCNYYPAGNVIGQFESNVCPPTNT